MWQHNDKEYNMQVNTVKIGHCVITILSFSSLFVCWGRGRPSLSPYYFPEMTAKITEAVSNNSVITVVFHLWPHSSIFTCTNETTNYIIITFWSHNKTKTVKKPMYCIFYKLNRNIFVQKTFLQRLYMYKWQCIGNSSSSLYRFILVWDGSLM